MKKRLFSLLVLFSMLGTFWVPVAQVSAATTLQENGYYYQIIDNEAVITNVNYKSVEGDIVVPSTIGGYPVTAIGKAAFDYCSLTTGITLPDSIRSIASSAFSYCRKLTSIKLPSGLTTIDVATFKECAALTEISIPASVTSIGDSAFMYCSALKSISLPESVTQIGESAFYDCSALSDISLGQNINTIKRQAFYGTAFYNNPENWDNNILYYGKYLLEAKEIPMNDVVLIRNGTILIAQHAFYYSGGSVTLPDSMTRISDYAFYGSAITSITFGKNIQEIGSHAFGASRHLHTINWNQKISTIRDHAFATCESLKSVFIPDSVKSMDEYVFSYCESLQSARFGTGLTELPSSTFAYCDAISNVTLGPRMQVIGDYAFIDCPKLERISFPDSVRSIGQGAFAICYALKYIDFGNNLEFIGDNAFNSCIAETIHFPNTLKTIESHAFINCSTLKELVIPDSVETIGMQTFYNCPSLERLVIGNGVKEIPLYNFRNCTNLQTLQLGKNITTIADGTFTELNKLTEIIIPDRVQTIGTSSFTGCNELLYLKIGSSVTELSGNSFSYSDRVLKIFLPASLKKIGYYALSGNSYLTDVYYSGSESDWADIVWENEYDKFDDDVNIHFLYSSDRFVVNETRYSDIRVLVVERDNVNNEIANATVNINGCKKLTDINGAVSFEYGEIKSLKGPVLVEADGYISFYDPFYQISASGDIGISLQKRQEKAIYIQNLTAVNQDTKKSYNLTTRDSFTVNPLDKDTYTFSATVDWNSYEPGEIYLYGITSKNKVLLPGGTATLIPGELFEPGETVQLVIKTADETISAFSSLPLRVVSKPEKILVASPKMPPQAMDCIPFMPKIEMELGFSNDDIQTWGGKVLVEDGKYIIDFNYSVTDKKPNVPIKFFKNIELEAGYYGRIEIPFAEGVEAGGYIGSTIGVGKLLPIPPKNGWFVAGSVLIPYTVSIDLSTELESNFGLCGTYPSDLYWAGTFSPSLTADAFGGVGQDYEEVEVKAGIYGKMTGSLELEGARNTLSFNPSLAGDFGMRSNVKLWVMEWGADFTVGSFLWDKDGFRADWFNNDLSPEAATFASEPVQPWQLVGRRYLKKGGGFTADEPAGDVELFTTEVSNQKEQIIYQNIFENAEATLEKISTTDYLFYTIDDINRTPQNGLKLVYSKKNSDGTWTSPEAILDDGTIDSVISADGKFVIWEDLKEELTEATPPLDEVFAKTEVSVAYLNNDTWVTTRLTDNNTMEYAPTVKAYGNQAIAAWLSNSEGDFTGLTGVTNLHYSLFDGSSWSETVTVSDIGAVSRISAAYNYGTPYLFYKIGQSLYCYSPNNIEPTQLAFADVKRYTVDSYNNNIVLAYFDSENRLHYSDSPIYDDETVLITKNANPNSIPTITSGYSELYICWLDRQNGYDTLSGVRYENGSWSEKITFLAEDKDIISPRLTINSDKTFSASYLKSEKPEFSTSEGIIMPQVDLCVSTITPCYNLAINADAITYDEELYQNGGGLLLTLPVENIGEKTVSGYTAEIYENGIQIASQTNYTAVKPGAQSSFYVSAPLVLDGVGKPIEIRLVPLSVNDFDNSDNTAEIIIGTVDPTVTQSYLSHTDGQATVNAVITNHGTITAKSAEVKIYEGNNTNHLLATYPCNQILGGEELLIQHTVSEPASYYTVTIESATDINPYNNQSLAVNTSLQTDSGEKKLQILSAVMESDVITLSVSGSGISAPNEATLFVAAYSAEGRLKKLLSQDADAVLQNGGTAQFDCRDMDENFILRAFSWNSIAGMTPLGEVFEKRFLKHSDFPLSLKTECSRPDSSGMATLKISANLFSEKSETLTLFFAAYDTHNRLQRIISKEKVTIAPGSSSLSYPFDMKGLADSVTIQTFAWDSANGMIPRSKN